jgi:hypothetical protein
MLPDTSKDTREKLREKIRGKRSQRTGHTNNQTKDPVTLAEKIALESNDAYVLNVLQQLINKSTNATSMIDNVKKVVSSDSEEEDIPPTDIKITK